MTKKIDSSVLIVPERNIKKLKFHLTKRHSVTHIQHTSYDIIYKPIVMSLQQVMTFAGLEQLQCDITLRNIRRHSSSSGMHEELANNEWL